jgi:hypothetical protein
MRSALVFAAVLGLASAPALAVPAASTATSVGRTHGSPNEAAPRSATVPGSAANEHARAMGDNPAKVAKCGSFTPAQGCAQKPPSQPRG